MTDEEKLLDAKRLLTKHNAFFCLRGKEYLVFRKAEPKNVFVAKTKTINGLLRIARFM